ncbi:hypothetical protein DO71_5161 [Burkholderia pseudomallei]|nr:hypothetical protein DO71_5161 [Burkholderia pseudomallei]
MCDNTFRLTFDAAHGSASGRSGAFARGATRWPVHGGLFESRWLNPRKLTVDRHVGFI